MRSRSFDILDDYEKKLVLNECSDCVKFKKSHCLVFIDFHCLWEFDKPCPAKTTNLVKWRKTLREILGYNEREGYGAVTSDWIRKELNWVEDKLSKEAKDSFKEETRKSIRRGRSEGGRDKSPRRKDGKKISDSDYDIPLDWESIFRR